MQLVHCDSGLAPESSEEPGVLGRRKERTQPRRNALGTLSSSPAASQWTSFCVSCWREIAQDHGDEGPSARMEGGLMAKTARVPGACLSF